MTAPSTILLSCSLHQATAVCTSRMSVHRTAGVRLSEATACRVAWRITVSPEPNSHLVLIAGTLRRMGSRHQTESSDAFTKLCRGQKTLRHLACPSSMLSQEKSDCARALISSSLGFSEASGLWLWCATCPGLWLWSPAPVVTYDASLEAYGVPPAYGSWP